MASEYLLKKYKDVKPDEVRVLTKEEKRRNWWDYHKWHVVIGLVLFACLCNILWNAFGFGKTKPDYCIAYVGSTPLDEETIQMLKDGFEALSEDFNGDGKIVAEFSSYTAVKTDDSDALYYAQAAQVQLVSDITDGKSYFFLLENPDSFQEATSALCNLDGSLPKDGDLSAEGKFVYWSECPALASMELGKSRDFISGLAFARRGFWTEKKSPNLEKCEALWNDLTRSN